VFLLTRAQRGHAPDRTARARRGVDRAGGLFDRHRHRPRRDGDGRTGDDASDGTRENVSVFERGGRRYVRARTNGSTDYRVVDDPTSSVRQLYPNSTRTVIQHLAVEDATVELLYWNGQGYYRIYGTGARAPGFGLAENYTVDAVVATTGLVRRLRVSYTESPTGHASTSGSAPHSRTSGTDRCRPPAAPSATSTPSWWLASTT